MTKKIALIEDNFGDIKLFEEALKHNEIDVDLNVLTDGEQALEFFQSFDHDNRKPDIIILDLNLPRVSGIEILEMLKTSEHFKLIPVIILTTSKLNSDIHKTYDLGANAYFSKPLEVKKFYELISLIDSFWLERACLPNS